ncbi:hypothetical protein B0T21DRAFT_26913 [Apiosordaria backusii]|uniref:Uncharacterized protein n=1 Tax=Apiosordaria backusii TaxID=314023 RepID=A0AA40EZZ2_9PEZI|nr:hypothetical protein B0T21DRAFT_26913 [Apiosordaria backusii]
MLISFVTNSHKKSGRRVLLGKPNQERWVQTPRKTTQEKKNTARRKTSVEACVKGSIKGLHSYPWALVDSEGKPASRLGPGAPDHVLRPLRTTAYALHSPVPLPPKDGDKPIWKARQDHLHLCWQLPEKYESCRGPCMDKGGRGKRPRIRPPPIPPRPILVGFAGKWGRLIVEASKRVVKIRNAACGSKNVFLCVSCSVRHVCVRAWWRKGLFGMS